MKYDLISLASDFRQLRPRRKKERGQPVRIFEWRALDDLL